MTPRTAKVRAKLHFRPRILLTLQCLTHNFKGSIFQIHRKMNLEIPRGCRNNRADFFWRFFDRFPVSPLT